MNEEFKKTAIWKKVILGVDYGKKVMGLALYCPGRDPYPMPLGRIIRTEENSKHKFKSLECVLEELANYIENELVEIIVLGIPYFTDGKSSTMTEEVEKFGELLKTHFPDHCFYFQDETLTTFEAQERMKNSPKYNFKIDMTQIDALSAAIILEDFTQKILREEQSI